MSFKNPPVKLFEGESESVLSKGSICSRLKEVYNDLSIPLGEKMPDYGEEGRGYLLAEYRYDFRGSLTKRRDTSGNL